LDVTWTTKGTDHNAQVGIDTSSITSFTSEEFRPHFRISFVDERADLHDGERDQALDSAFKQGGLLLVDADQFVAAQAGKVPAPISQSTVAKSRFDQLKLPPDSPGPLLNVGEVIVEVEHGVGFNSVKLSLETTGRVVAESRAFPGLPPQPIAWMVGPETVERLAALAEVPKYHELPQDSDRTSEWLRITVGSFTGGTRSSEGVRNSDAPHEQLYDLGEELIASIITELTEPARPAPPALIAATKTDWFGSLESNTVGWPLSKPPSAFFDPSPETQCVLFSGTEAERLWEVLGPRNGSYRIEVYDPADTGIWGFDFEVAFTNRYLNCS
jgi:hypothetical protein